MDVTKEAAPSLSGRRRFCIALAAPGCRPPDVPDTPGPAAMDAPSDPDVVSLESQQPHKWCSDTPEHAGRRPRTKPLTSANVATREGLPEGLAGHVTLGFNDPHM